MPTTIGPVLLNTPILRPALATPVQPGSLLDRVTLQANPPQRNEVWEAARSGATSGFVLGAPSALGAAFGWGGMFVGLAGVAAMVRLGVHCEGDRKILMPLALLTGGIAGVAGTTMGWPAAAVCGVIGIAYGIKCS